MASGLDELRDIVVCNPFSVERCELRFRNFSGGDPLHDFEKTFHSSLVLKSKLHVAVEPFI
jgi:hypothetical protein